MFVCYQKFAAAGDIFDAEMDSSDSDSDSDDDDDDGNHRKQDDRETVLENKGQCYWHCKRLLRTVCGV